MFLLLLQIGPPLHTIHQISKPFAMPLGRALARPARATAQIAAILELVGAMGSLSSSLRSGLASTAETAAVSTGSIKVLGQGLKRDPVPQ